MIALKCAFRERRMRNQAICQFFAAHVLLFLRYVNRVIKPRAWPNPSQAERQRQATRPARRPLKARRAPKACPQRWG